MGNGNHVRPGEVISSSLINEILDRLNALEENRPDVGDIRIDGFDPPSEQEVGRVLAIFGSNLHGHDITIDNVRVPRENLLIIDDPSRDRLRFVVPELGSLPAGGRIVTIQVTDGTHSDRRNYRLLPSSAGIPIPLIESIQSEDDSNTVQIGELAIITGSNFSENPALNTIKFTPRISNQDVEPYPRDDGDPLEVRETSKTKIAVVVPNMSEIVVSEFTTNVLVTIEVEGAVRSANGEFATFRPA